LRLLPNTFQKKVRVSAELWMIRSIPMEKDRLECVMTAVEFYFDKLSENVADVPAAFIFNLSESGFQDGVDRRERTVIVSSKRKVEKIGIVIGRGTK
jgi:hypothetical protein